MIESILSSHVAAEEMSSFHPTIHIFRLATVSKADRRTIRRCLVFLPTVADVAVSDSVLFNVQLL